jgi:AcrR family transcriptional regulator
MSWQRARSKEQKKERKEEILNAASELLQRDGLDNVSLNGIARHAGVSKANIYRYFESREDIYLHLAQKAFEKWTADVEHRLAPLAGSDDEEAVARALVASLETNPTFSSLMAVMAGVLERNVTVEAVVAFKTAGLDLLLRLNNALQVAIPSLSPEQARQFMTIFHILVTGIWPASHPPAPVVEALKRPELQGMCVVFEKDLGIAVAAVLRGLRASPH